MNQITNIVVSTCKQLNPGSNSELQAVRNQINITNQIIHRRSALNLPVVQELKLKVVLENAANELKGVKQ